MGGKEQALADAYEQWKFGLKIAGLVFVVLAVASAYGLYRRPEFERERAAIEERQRATEARYAAVTEAVPSLAQQCAGMEGSYLIMFDGSIVEVEHTTASPEQNAKDWEAYLLKRFEHLEQGLKEAELSDLSTTMTLFSKPEGEPVRGWPTRKGEIIDYSIDEDLTVASLDRAAEENTPASPVSADGPLTIMATCERGWYHSVYVAYWPEKQPVGVLMLPKLVEKPVMATPSNPSGRPDVSWNQPAWERWRAAMPLEMPSGPPGLAAATAGTPYERGLALKRARKWDQAAEQLRTAVEAAPTDVKAHFALAWVLREAGDRAGARQEFQRVVELAPNSPEASEWKKALARLGS